MKRILLLALAVAVCSGQMCGEANTTPTGGSSNICDRQWFNLTYRVAWNPPTGIGAARAGSSVASADLNQTWTWEATSPETKFSLVVFKSLAEKTLPEFRDAWLDSFQQSGEFTVLNESYVTLSDGAQGWYLAVSPADDASVLSEFVMTVTQERLVYLNAIYAVNYVTEAQAEQIGDALISLCADLN